MIKLFSIKNSQFYKTNGKIQRWEEKKKKNNTNIFFLFCFRSLEVFEQHGVKHSELLKAQRIAGGSGLGGPLRYRNAILLWINCDMVSEFHNFFFLFIIQSNNLRRLNLSYKLFHKENIV